MYEKFYGLNEKPFSLLPDPEYLYLSEKHEMALSLLEYGILNQAGFCVVSGKPGAGKTTLVRHLLSQFGDDVTVGLLSNTHDSFGELLIWILMSFDLEYTDKGKPEMYQTFVDFLISEYADNRYTVLIVDEAQNMSIETLEELRMLSNVNSDKDQVLQVILVGQPGLLDKLKCRELEQFAQRIAVDYNLETLNLAETRGYIHHRLSVANGNAALFTDEACKKIFHYTLGTPRLINMLCDTALVYGYAEHAGVIDEAIIDEVIKEREGSAVLPKFQHSEIVNDEAVYQLEQVVASKVANVGADATIQLVASAGDKESRLSPRLQTQAEHVARALELNKKTAVNEITAITQRSSDKESSSDKDSATKDTSEDIKTHSEATATPSQETSYADSGHEEKEPMDMTDNNPVNTDNDIVAVDTPSQRMVGSKLSFGILGFAAGLLFSVVALVYAFYGDQETQSTDTSAARVEQTPLVAEDGRISALQRERDAAIAEARALQRERDAAIAISKAQEELREAKLVAERARSNERAAAAKAERARIRAKTAELETQLARQQEKQSAIEAARAEQAKKSLVDDIKPIKPVEVLEKPVAQVEITESGIEVSKQQSAAPEQQAKPAASNNGSNQESRRFSPDPCKGPSAVFLSTCKK